MKKLKKIYIEITNICNQNCSFCSKGTKQKKEMTVEEFEHVLKEIKPYTNYVYLHVKGEPLLHSHLDEILTLCEKYDMKINITTNGTLLLKRLPIILKHSNIRQINISLHSFETGMNAYVQNVFIACDEIMKKMDTVIVYRFWALPSYQLSEENQKIIDEICNHYELNEELYQKIITDKNIKLGNTLYLNKAPLFQWPTLQSDIVGDRGFCHGLTRQLGILVDGTVIPCCLDSDGIISLGNIFEKHMKEIVDGEKCRMIVKSFKDGKVIEELCQKCSYRLRFSKGAERDKKVSHK